MRDIHQLSDFDQTHFKLVLESLARRVDLSEAETYAAVSFLMSGFASDVQSSAFLMGLRVKGETVEELTGAVNALRAKMIPVKAPKGTFDIVGTGGDHLGTYNISTASAFVLAAGGVPVAKHGNRAFSSRSGAADVLTALGVNIHAPVPVMESALSTLGICFLFAPNHHPAVAHVQPIRSGLGIRTIFNLLGPMCNPASVKMQLIGVYSTQWLEPMVRALMKSGSERVWCVCGEDGVDELSISSKTHCVEAYNGVITQFTLSPEEVGITPSPIESLHGGDAQYNAEAMRAVFSGAPSAYAQSVILNSGAGFLISGAVNSLQDGVEKARELLHTQKVLTLLDAFIEYTHSA